MWGGISTPVTSSRVRPLLEIRTFQTVADMVSSSNLDEGQVVQTKGYYSAGDKGGARYLIEAAGAPYDGLVNHQLAGLSVATLLIEGAIDVFTCGAAGDNATDDAAAIQAALDSGAKDILFPTSDGFIVGSRLEVSGVDGLTIRGRGATIKAADGRTVGTDTQILFFTSCDDLRISGLTIDGNRSNRVPAEATSHLLHLENCHRFRVSDVYAINGTTDGFYVRATDKADSATFSTGFIFENCHALNNYRQGMSIINAENGLILGGSYNGTTGTNPQAGIDIESNTGAAEPSNLGISLIGVEFSSNAGPGLQVANEGNPYGVRVTNCLFSLNTGNAIDAGSDMVIDGCTFNGSNAYGVQASGSADTIVRVSGCSFKDFSSFACVDDSNLTGRVSVRDCHFENIVSAVVGGCAYLLVDGNLIESASAAALNITSDHARITRNVIEGATGRAIYCTGDHCLIDGNEMIDVATVLGAYLQAEGNGNIVTKNTCRATTPATGTLGIRVGSGALAVTLNECIGLHSTDPYTTIGGNSAVFFAHNVGGTANGARVNKTPTSASVTSTSSALNDVAASINTSDDKVTGSMIFNTTTGKPVFSTGAAASSTWVDAAGTVAHTPT